MKTEIERQGWPISEQEREILAGIQSLVGEGRTDGKIHPEIGHCDDSSGFERWTICPECGNIEVACFCCGSVDRSLTTCTCRHARSH